jgi:hypothetical protein
VLRAVQATVLSSLPCPTTSDGAAATL